MMLKALGLCAALAMLASLFVPWIEMQFGPSFVPWDAIKSLADLDPQLRSRMFERMPPPEVITFGLSFVAAILYLLTAASSRLLALVAGAMPFLTLGILLVRAGRGSNGFGRNMPSFDSGDLSEVLDIAGPGLTLWFGSGAVLLLTGLFLRSTRAR